MAEATYLIALNCGQRLTPTERLEERLFAARDWFRWGRDCYLIRTNQSADYWYGNLRAVLDPTDNIMVVPIERAKVVGWASKLASEWLFKNEPFNPNGT